MNEHEPAVDLVERFAVIPEAMIYSSISDGAMRVYAALVRHGSDPDNCWPSYPRLAALTHKSERTVIRAVEELERHGWVERFSRYKGEGKQTANGYRVHRVRMGDVGDRGDTHDTPTPVTRVTPRGVTSVTRTRAIGTRAIERDPPTPAVTPPEPDDTAPAALADSPPGFDEFWTTYPRKEGKGAARKAYAKALGKVTAGVLLAGAQRYRDAPSRTARPLRYTAHPATWLNAERWDDEPESDDTILAPQPKGWSVLSEMHQELQDERVRDTGDAGHPDGGVPHLRAVETDGRDVGGRLSLGAGG